MAAILLQAIHARLHNGRNHDTIATVASDCNARTQQPAHSTAIAFMISN